jgi:hypothetical protein
MMIKRFFIALLLASIATLAVEAQTTAADSLVKVAQADAKNFRLNNVDFKRFRKNRGNSGSDYFKPLAADVSNSALLSDSVYVMAYRQAAYAKTHHRHTAGHYILWGGVGLAVVVLVATAAASNSVLTGWH